MNRDELVCALARTAYDLPQCNNEAFCNSMQDCTNCATVQITEYETKLKENAIKEFATALIQNFNDVPRSTTPIINYTLKKCGYASIIDKIEYDM